MDRHIYLPHIEKILANAAGPEQKTYVELLDLARHMKDVGYSDVAVYVFFEDVCLLKLRLSQEPDTQILSEALEMLFDGAGGLFDGYFDGYDVEEFRYNEQTLEQSRIDNLKWQTVLDFDGLT